VHVSTELISKQSPNYYYRSNFTSVAKHKFRRYNAGIKAGEHEINRGYMQIYCREDKQIYGSSGYRRFKQIYDYHIVDMDREHHMCRYMFSNKTGGGG